MPLPDFAPLGSPQLWSPEYLAQVWEAEASAHPELLYRLLSCLAAWLLNPHLPTSAVAASPLVPALFTILVPPTLPILFCPFS